MVKLRLQRFGSNKKPFYRIVASDSKAPRDGKFLEIIGTLDTLREPAVLKIDEDKALKWLNSGAKPTDTVRSLLSKEGIIKKFTEQKK